MALGNERALTSQVAVPALRVSATYGLFRQFHGWSVDQAFLTGFRNVKCEVAVADYTAHERWLEIHHRVP